jgi:pyruvate dehydrogenase E1 component
MYDQASAIDSAELEEWQASIDDIIGRHGLPGATQVIQQVVNHVRLQGQLSLDSASSHLNTYDQSYDTQVPADLMVGEQAEKFILWNAMVMVVRANQQHSELGGHLSTYASSSTLYRIGFDYFFRGDDEQAGDLVFFQGHASPGIYARSFLEGRFDEHNLAHFRQESMNAKGLSSYPHPWLMPDYWQFPTVSMGLGPIQAVYQAYWQRYLIGRGLATTERRIWAFCGDGEMDEPESTAALSLASREKLDNCIFVVNCNLQRLDGPVRGNGQIITELEAQFLAVGWRVIKVLWSSGWDKLWQLDQEGLLQTELAKLVDGQYQALYAQGPQALLDYLSQKSPAIRAICEQLTPHEISQLLPGGHDPIKVHTAYKHAVEKTGKPTVILAHTIKGFQLGQKTHARNVAHNKKKMGTDDLLAYADYCKVPLTKADIETPEFYHPGIDAPVVQYLLKRRQALGGYLPKRQPAQETLPALPHEIWSTMRDATGEKKSSTTMAFVRMLNQMLRHEPLKPYIVPIVADEARTFGMEGLFKKIGIYASAGQQYRPEDSQSIMCYDERADGQLLQEGLTEAGALSAWLAAATSYAASQRPMLPMYIFYSMFGFQRVGDLLWLAGDIRARGFLFGATAGRTTLGGEGLQHNDGQSLMIASHIPNCISYDPCFHYEVATIMAHGAQHMGVEQNDVFYYITLMNENYVHPAMPAAVEGDIIKGMYVLPDQDTTPDIQLLGSGTILREVIAAAQQLRDYGIRVRVYSVTSFTELAREASVQQRREVLTGESEVSHLHKQLLPDVPVLAATDYVRAYPDQIRSHITNPYDVLGTDGFGRSDCRKNLRRFFGVDADSIVLRTIAHLVKTGYPGEKLLQQLREKVSSPVVERDPTRV